MKASGGGGAGGEEGTVRELFETGGGDVGGEDPGGGGTVVVGLKLDAESRELLTWALVKVAQSGDRVVALHVLKPSAAAAGKSTLISLVKSFDSVLAAYEGFCNLKQVDLKLKVCRGSSVREMLVQEAKSYSSAKIIVGISRANHTIPPMTSVAQYCSRKLSNDYSVFGVENGKVAYQRRAKTSTKNSRDDLKHRSFVLSFHQSMVKKVLKDATCTAVSLKPEEKCCDCKNECGSDRGGGTRVLGCSPLSETSCSKSTEDISGEKMDNSLALVPFQAQGVIPGSSSRLSCEHHMMKPGCQLFHRKFLLKRLSFEKFSVKKLSLGNWFSRPSSLHCSAAVYPDKKHNNTRQDEGSSCIVPYKSNSKHLPKELEGLQEKYSSTCRLFSYGELLSLTSNFIPERLIGRGGNSQVYRGCLPDGRELAVKSLKPSGNTLKEFVSEIDIVTTLHHKNIISIFGFCYENNNLLLVYDFLARGSLEDNLHGCKKDELSFGWNERHRVALAVAEALDYLHNISVRPVIHRDVKSSNILLLDDYEPLLTDFGLATFCSTASSHLTCTDVAGTFGYLAPEYFVSGKVDDKVDVYAYGVVLLELLSGRKPINDRESLVTWAKQVLKAGKFSQLLDPTLGSDYDPDQIERMALAAALCIRSAHQHRPRISSILRLLQGDVEVIRWARQEVNNARDATDGEADGVDMESHLSLVLQGLEDDSSLSSFSSEHSVIIGMDYLRGRWSRSSSFD